MIRAGFPLIAGIALLAAACDSPRSARHYDAWLATPQAARHADYGTYLQHEGVGDVLPMESLLRSGRSWRRCGMGQFVVPPEPEWPNMVPTLRVVRQLGSAGLLRRASVASVYRSEAFNRCEGGSSQSRHLRNNALDFDLPASVDSVARLCAWWRAHGSGQKLGLGFYTRTKIHLDTSGFRTWGSDFTHRTSLCNATDAVQSA